MREIVFDDINELYKRIGRNVAKIRKLKNMSQLDLALAIGLKSVGLISVAEVYHNKKHFNIEHLSKIAVILEVDICEFFKNSDDI
ncbi:MAG: helix-turn-helix domain-containing protein [Campylobacteraceae bacterium]|jgi:transcriptional regulator with XRE-family HTH domain|nr:helix-turn-helix domain-containing protein [Campylobacteraceae bacterium]